MTNEEIIDMARQAGFDPHDMSADFTCNLDNIEGFAKLVAEAEREACAKIVENRILDDKNENIKKGYFFAQQSIAEDIRARGQE